MAKATFERQKALIASGFTTRTVYDQAQEGLRTAEGALEAAKAELGTSKDALGYTALRAEAAGVVTARNLEVGQVVQAAQPVFSLAQDGERDAVFDVYESLFFGDLDGSRVSLALVSDTGVTAIGHVREVSPAIDREERDHPRQGRHPGSIGSDDAWKRRCRNRQSESPAADRIALECIGGGGIEARGLDRRSGDQNGCAQAGDDRRL